MALGKITKGNNTYFELYISCPVCNSNGQHTPQSYWQHHNCGGALYVGDNAHYNCNKCDSDSHVKGWKYGCPQHSNGADYEFLSTTSEGLAAVVSTAGQLVTETGLPWLQQFLSNLGEF